MTSDDDVGAKRKQSMAGRVESVTEVQNRTSQQGVFGSASGRLSVVIITLFSWLVVVNVLAWVVIEYGIVGSQPDDYDKKFSEFESPYWETVVEVVPFVQDWYRGLDLDLDLLDANKSPLLPTTSFRPVPDDEASCLQAFLESGIDLNKFDEYDTFFRDDSVMALAQTGEYHGAEGIAEYIAFLDRTSPYIDASSKNRQQLEFKHFDSNICEFRAVRHQTFEFSEHFTGFPRMSVDVTLMTGFYFHLKDEYTTRVNVYYPANFIAFFFGKLLNTDNVREFVCSVLSDPCSNQVDQANQVDQVDSDSCIEQLAQLPAVQGDMSYINGNSQGCRFLHAVFARENVDHCPHLSFTPMLDKNNKIKCQETADTLPTDLFDEADFEAYTLFNIQEGIDPRLGYSVPRCGGESCTGIDMTPFNASAFVADISVPAENETANETASCIASLLDRLLESFPKTSPLHVELVLQNLGLANQPLVRQTLKDLLGEPQPLSSRYRASMECLSMNQAGKELTCAFEDEYDWGAMMSSETHDVFEYLVNQAAVYDRLVETALQKPQFLFEIVDVMANERRQFKEAFIKEHFDGDQDAPITKYRSALLVLQRLTTSFAQDSNSEGTKESLLMNILDSVRLDVENDLEANARVGLALAAAVQYDSFVDANMDLPKFHMSLEWQQAYLAWAIANIWGSFPGDFVNAFVIPPVSCAASSLEDSREATFISRITISASLALMHQFQLPSTSAALISGSELTNLADFYKDQADTTALASTRYTAALALGASNLKNSVVSSPSRETVERMLYALCLDHCHDGSWGVTNTVLHSRLDREQFQVYLGFVIWVTCLLAGIGLEVLVFVFILSRDGWSDDHDIRWKLAQFVFPLFAATTLGLASTRSYLALPFLVAGLWKFGYPETILYQFEALYGTSQNRITRLADLLNAFGTMAHHGASAMLICMILAGAIFPDQRVLSAILILLTQHWIILLKYVNLYAFFFLELFLEFWFEWIVISEFQYYTDNHWTAALAAGVMLFAHWMYLIAAGCELCRVSEEDSNDDGARPRRATLAKRTSLMLVACSSPPSQAAVPAGNSAKHTLVINSTELTMLVEAAEGESKESSSREDAGENESGKEDEAGSEDKSSHDGIIGNGRDGYTRCTADPSNRTEDPTDRMFFDSSDEEV